MRLKKSVQTQLDEHGNIVIDNQINEMGKTVGEIFQYIKNEVRPMKDIVDERAGLPEPVYQPSL